LDQSLYFLNSEILLFKLAKALTQWPAVKVVDSSMDPEKAITMKDYQQGNVRLFSFTFTSSL